MIAFYKYFSWWVFAWFLAYKTGLTKANPWFLYVLLVCYIIIRYTIHGWVFFVNGVNYLPNVSIHTQLTVGAVSIFVDVMPFFLLKEKTVTQKDIVFAFILGITYIISMITMGYPIISQYTYSHFNTALNGASPHYALEMISGIR